MGLSSRSSSGTTGAVSTASGGRAGARRTQTFLPSARSRTTSWTTSCIRSMMASLSSTTWPSSDSRRPPPSRRCLFSRRWCPRRTTAWRRWWRSAGARCIRTPSSAGPRGSRRWRCKRFRTTCACASCRRRGCTRPSAAGLSSTSPRTCARRTWAPRAARSAARASATLAARCSSQTPSRPLATRRWASCPLARTLSAGPCRPPTCLRAPRRT
mmetsp:Transcript_19258/g.45820  ORF Transcript_19258/g.45820 Transcript_19258/m.45820 type:complete len:213 (+) Transcript_19258:584-1222(+)